MPSTAISAFPTVFITFSSLGVYDAASRATESLSEVIADPPELLNPLPPGNRLFDNVRRGIEGFFHG
jgi:hypothetical protein